MRTILANKDVGTFDETLDAAIEAADALRDALINLMPSAPETESERLATMTGRDLHEKLGYLLMLSSKNATWVNMTVTGIVQYVATNSPQSIAEVQSAAVAGQVRAEMSCTCGQCDTCQVRARFGDEETRKNLTAALTPNAPSRIVGPNGQQLH